MERQNIFLSKAVWAGAFYGVRNGIVILDRVRLIQPDHSLISSSYSDIPSAILLKSLSLICTEFAVVPEHEIITCEDPNVLLAQLVEFSVSLSQYLTSHSPYREW